MPLMSHPRDKEPNEELVGDQRAFDAWCEQQGYMSHQAHYRKLLQRIAELEQASRKGDQGSFDDRLAKLAERILAREQVAHNTANRLDGLSTSMGEAERAIERLDERISALGNQVASFSPVNLQLMTGRIARLEKAINAASKVLAD